MRAPFGHFSHQFTDTTIAEKSIARQLILQTFQPLEVHTNRNLLITQMTHLHTIVPLHASASTNTRDPVSAAVQIATHTGSPSSDSTAHWKRGGGYAPRPITGMRPLPWRNAPSTV